MMVLVPVTGFIALSWDLTRFRRYLWAWGVAIFLLLALWWPIAVNLTIPGSLEVWVYDLLGRTSGRYELMTKPFWYYGIALAQVTAPWILLAPIAVAATWREVFYKRHSPERFLWVWALSVPLILSFFSGKHHHYLLHCVAPWSILAALGIRHLGRRLAVIKRSPKVGAAILFGVLAVIYGILLCTHKTVHHQDGEFIRRVANNYPSGPFFVDQSITDLHKGFQVQFYLPQWNTRILHNLSFLRAKDITEDRIYVITEYGRREGLTRFGDIRLLMQSEKTGRQQGPGTLLSLFELNYHEYLNRVDTEGISITPMQAMYRTPGPVLE